MRLAVMVPTFRAWQTAYQGKALDKVEEIDAQRLRRTFAVNIEAMFHLVRYALAWMKPGSDHQYGVGAGVPSEPRHARLPDHQGTSSWPRTNRATSWAKCSA